MCGVSSSFGAVHSHLQLLLTHAGLFFAGNVTCACIFHNWRCAHEARYKLEAKRHTIHTMPHHHVPHSYCFCEVMWHKVQNKKAACFSACTLWESRLALCKQRPNGTKYLCCPKFAVCPCDTNVTKRVFSSFLPKSARLSAICWSEVQSVDEYSDVLVPYTSCLRLQPTPKSRY